MTASMKSLVIHAARDLRIEDRAPAPPASGEVQVRISHGGICGSDLHYFNHGGFGPVRLREPMVLGHEVAGEIIAVGDDVRGFSVGDAAAVSPSLPCETCHYCQRGQANHCLNMQFFGSAMPFPHIQGAFQQILTTDARRCVPVNGLSLAAAAMAEPLAVVLHAVKQSGSLRDKTVLMSGCGPIGLLTVLAARHAQAETIIATDLSPFTLAAAKQIGADYVINVADRPDGLHDWHRDKGQIDVQFECSGAAPALKAGIPALRPGGIIVQLGLGGDMPVPMMALTAKELQLRGSFRFHEEYSTAIKLMQEGAIDPTPLITSTMPLRDAETAFRAAGDRSHNIKVQIDFTA